MNNLTKQYKTLPGGLGRPKEEKRRDHHSHNPLFGLNLNLNFSNLISTGVNFFQDLRKKTPASTPTSSPSSSTSSATNSLCEAIEMTAFPAVPETGGTGAGHFWREVGTHNPTWCDLCGEIIWGLYAVGAWQCDNCNYTAHLKCRERVFLDCSASPERKALEEADDLSEVEDDDTDGQIQSLCRDEPGVSRVSSTDLICFPSFKTARSDFSLPALSLLSKGSESTMVESDQFHTLHDVKSITSSTRDTFHTLKDVDDLTPDRTGPPSLLSLAPEDLDLRLALYNSTLPASQACVWDSENSLYTGYIRVDMNLARPINVISGCRPPSSYNIISDTNTMTDRTLTTFYLPPGTERALHITSHTTTQDVVRVLLKKFRVADNPHKYALYERYEESRRDSLPKSKSLSRLKMRKLPEEEKPLVLALLSSGGESRKFVLQENDPGEINWDRFSFPELKNFLLILDREEAWYKRRIHEKYETVQDEILKLLQEKRDDQEEEVE